MKRTYRFTASALVLTLLSVNACAQDVKVMISGGFKAALEKLAPMRGWLNIFNTTFTLHLREESLDEVWVTRKPTSDGHVTSVELFAKDGTQIAQLYGQRSEGHPEQTQWRQQVDRLTREGQPA